MNVYLKSGDASNKMRDTRTQFTKTSFKVTG
jgi:hypothetical protein